MSVMPGIASRSHAFMSAGVSGALMSRRAAMRVSCRCSLLLQARAGIVSARTATAARASVRFNIRLLSKKHARAGHRGSTRWVGCLFDRVLIARGVVDPADERPVVLVIHWHHA